MLLVVTTATVVLLADGGVGVDIIVVVVVIVDVSMCVAVGVVVGVGVGMRGIVVGDAGGVGVFDGHVADVAVDDVGVVGYVASIAVMCYCC